jgi:hypothetical protein
MSTLSEAISDFPINRLANVSVLGNGHIEHFCPICQKNGTRADGRRWSRSKRKGYILIEADNLDAEPVFYCHNDHCPSRKLIAGRKLIPLDIYADFVMNQVSMNTHPLSNGLSAEPSKGGHPPVMVAKLPPGTKSDLKKGGQLDRQVAQRNGRQRCLWTGYADRKAGRAV